MSDANKETEKNAQALGCPAESCVMWRADTEQWKPVQVDCPNGLWPNDDSDGEQIFDNTHFKNEIDAWLSLKRSIDSRVSFSGGLVLQKESQLVDAQKCAADAAKSFLTYRNNREEID